MSPTSAKPRSANGITQPQNWSGSKDVLTEEAFRRMVLLERKRSERTQRPFAVLLMETRRSLSNGDNAEVLSNVLSVLQAATRDTDLMGWSEAKVSVGVMFTEVALENELILSAILSRIHTTLREKLTTEQFSQIKFSYHLFPEELGRINPVSERSVSPPLSYVAGSAPNLEHLR